MPPCLRLYATLPNTRTLGPFCRFAVWVQGCPRCCPGCMTPDARPTDGGYSVDVTALADDIVKTSDIEGVTLSGGEPFLQAEALVCLIEAVRSKRDLGVIVYTGYTLEELRHAVVSEGRTDIGAFLERIDLLIDGPYIIGQDDGLSLRGSSNQVIHSLTDRYAGVADQYYEHPRREVEIHLLKNEIFLAGMPGQEILKKWKERGGLL